MITCHKDHLRARCQQRGYTLEEVMPCVVSQDGDIWTIDEKHWSYPARSRTGAPHAATNGGPGTELKALLKFLGFTSTPNCSCNARARAMDANEAKEPGWCEANIETILDWLKEQADARGLPFLRAGAKIIVKRAIANAKRKKAADDNK
jgi:hypothetical protein